MCFSFFPFFWKNSLKELEREDQELSFFLFFSLFALLCLVSLCFSFFFFFWLGNGGFHSEAGETLEGSFSAISKSNFASKILNTKLELESLRKRDWKTMDIDEKNEIFKKIVIFLFEKWTQNFQNIWIVVADFPPLDPPCLYDLSYGRRLDPNTKAFSAAYNDAVDIATTIKLHFLSLKSSKNRWNLGFQPVHIMDDV